MSKQQSKQQPKQQSRRRRRRRQQPKETEYPTRKIKKSNYYVSMTDRYMSGWGTAEGKASKFVVGCETYEQAQQIKRAAMKKEEMRYINIHTSRPHFSGMQFVVSFTPFSCLGEIWTGINKEEVEV